MHAVNFSMPTRGLENDPAENQIMRIRQLAAMALGAIGDPAALEALERRMEDNRDPRVQVAAAKAILHIVNRVERSSLPLGGHAAN